MKVRIIKSDLSTVNAGRCGSANNSRYRGASAVYVVTWDDPKLCNFWACSRKWLAEEVAAFVESGEYTGGDMELAFAQSPRAARYLSADGASIEPCFNPEEPQA